MKQIKQNYKLYKKIRINKNKLLIKNNKIKKRKLVKVAAVQ